MTFKGFSGFLLSFRNTEPVRKNQVFLGIKKRRDRKRQADWSVMIGSFSESLDADFEIYYEYLSRFSSTRQIKDFFLISRNLGF